MSFEIIISKLRFWLTTRFDCYVVDVISTWLILHQSTRKVIFCEITELIKRVTNSSFKNIRMLTLKSHCKKYFMNSFSQIFLTNVFAEIKESLTRSLQSKFSENDFQKQLMNAMLAINMSFRSMKHFEFIRFINMLWSNTRISKRTLLKNIVRKKHNIVRQKILQDMKSSTKINFAINNWTNSNNLAFMKVIDYFIDHEWRFRKILLAFKHFLDSHIDKTMSRKVMNCQSAIYRVRRIRFSESFTIRE
jgi:hypothetical protein